VFGVTMESTSQAGSGPAMPVGRALQPATRREIGPSATNAIVPVPAYEVTTMPLPQGRCQGKYTEDAKAAAVEGTVVLDLIIDETGRVRDVRVVSGLGHGLTEAAVAAAKDCRFSPGEKQGTAVPVRVRGFKIRFVMQEND
jgi:TonB family protein